MADSSSPKRKAIAPSIRFEVFKRDAFTCQYCGQKAPDVVLHVDHIRPVADGGENDILNLLTACSSCNGGKGAKTLDDNSTLEKQRKQLEELNERRNQLELLVRWRESLIDLEGDYVKAVQNEFLKYGPYTANETAEKEIARWVKKYSIEELFTAINTSFTQYIRSDDAWEVTAESWSRAFDTVPRIAEMNRRGGLTEEMKRLFYARGILRRRLRFVKENEVMGLMKDAVAAGLEVESVVDIAKRCTNWRQFEDIMWSWILGGENEQNS